MGKYNCVFVAGIRYKAELPKLSHIPLWFLHGEKEGNYGKYAREMFAVMDTLNEESGLTAIPGYGHPIQFVWCSSKYNLFDWLMQYRVGDLTNPTWHTWLNAQDLLDGKGRITEKVDEPMPDDIARALGLRKARR